MTAYIVITDLETDPEAPLTSELAKKWRDNPIAMFEGASGAPRILADAFPDFAAGSTEIINWVMPASTVKSITRAAGSNGQTVQVITTCTYQAIKAGTLRYSTEMRKSGAYTSGSDGFIVYVNGTSAGSQNATTSWATYTVDFTFSAGDEISVSFSVSSTVGQGGQTDYRNLKLLGNQRGLFRL